MRWDDERYVRVYTRDTVDWAALSWEARALFVLLLRKVDRAGLLPLGRAGARGIAGLVQAPPEVVDRALPELVADGCVRLTDAGLHVPNFLAAQESSSSDAQRKRRSREAATVGAMSQNVTESHNRSQVVTPCCAVPFLAVPTRAVPGESAREPEPAPEPPRPDPEGATAPAPAAPPTPIEEPKEPEPEVAQDGPLDVPTPVLASEPLEPAKTAKRGTKADRQTRGTRCPDAGDADVATFLDRQGLPALSSPQGALVAAMLDWHAAAGTLSLSWGGSWRTWQRKAVSFLRPGETLPTGPYRDPSAPPRAIDPAEVPGTPEYLAASSAHSRRCWARDDAKPENQPGGHKWRIRQAAGLHLVPPIPMPATHEEQLAVLDQLASGMGRP